MISASAFIASNGGSGSGSVGDQTMPTGVANMVFDAAKSGDFSKLKSSCDDFLIPDGDSKKVCGVADGDDEYKKMFKEYFSKGKVV